jgi:hypothetical protein
VLLYCSAVIMRWGNIVQRYMVPAAPLLVIGVWNGMRLMRHRLPRVPATVLTSTLLVAFVAINGLLLATDIFIAQSRTFGSQYYAGYAMKIVQAAQYLEERQINDGQVAVSADYYNLNLRRPNSYAERQLSLLTGRKITSVPPHLSSSVPDSKMIEWANARDIHYYLYRTPVSPWRVWHFRMPDLQAWLTGKPVEVYADWELYELENGEARLVTLPDEVKWPREVSTTMLR